VIRLADLREISALLIKRRIVIYLCDGLPSLQVPPTVVLVRRCASASRLRGLWSFSARFR